MCDQAPDYLVTKRRLAATNTRIDANETDGRTTMHGNAETLIDQHALIL